MLDFIKFSKICLFVFYFLEKRLGHGVRVKNIKPRFLLGREVTMKYVSIFSFIALFALTSCTGMGVQQGKKGQVGAVGGGAAGAIIGQAIGHDTQSTLIGTAIGTMLGYIVGNEADKADAQRVAAVAESVPSGQPVSWRNPDTGRTVTAVAGPARPGPNGPCRPMTIRGTVPGRSPETARITVCRRINPSTLEAEWVVQQ